MGRSPVSFTALTPLSFLGRSAEVYPDKTAIVYEGMRWTYAGFADDAQRLARGLQASGVAAGERVAFLSPNVPPMVIAHFGVPLAGASLVAINIRLSGEEIRYILDHSGATLLVVDSMLLDVIDPIRALLRTVREVITFVDPYGPGAEQHTAGPTWEDLLARGDSGVDLLWGVEDERGTITINYTSGTTGTPKGVMYHHRGAYLTSMAEIVHGEFAHSSVYLWTVPMYHCNGWCDPWTLTAVGGTHVCLREVRGEVIWRLLDEHGATHVSGAPAVLTMLMNAESAHVLDHLVVTTTGGAPPSPTTILEMERLGFRIVHGYGLTETYGPYTVCERQEQWAELEPEQRARLRARQGVGRLHTEPLRLVEQIPPDADPESVVLVDVPHDGTTVGEVVMRGNSVMSGYFRDEEATARSFAGGWFHSGDLGVIHPDGYVELRDRAKDIIVSGGENISTIEVEHAVTSHPAVLEAAVIAVPDATWGERPRAYVVVRHGHSITGDEIIAHVRGRLARYKAPRDVAVIEELPKTSTGKIQKFELRRLSAREGSRSATGGE